jgi:hypothetical protein
VAHTCNPEEVEIRKIEVQSQPRQIVQGPYLKKPFTKNRLME